MNDDKTYDILYDDGDDELNVKPSLMKREASPTHLVWTRRSTKAETEVTAAGHAHVRRRKTEAKKKEPYVIPKQYDVLDGSLGNGGRKPEVVDQTKTRRFS